MFQIGGGLGNYADWVAPGTIHPAGGARHDHRRPHADDAAARMLVRAGMRRGLDAAASRWHLVHAHFGTLDRSRVVGAAGSRAVKDSGAIDGLGVVCFEGLGHHLGPQEGDLYGPIDPGMVGHAGRWLNRPAG